MAYPGPGSPRGAEAADLDKDTLEQLRELDDDGDALRCIVSLYLEGWHDRVEELADAARAADLRRVASAAHSLKGSSATVGATAVAGLAARIESEARRELLPPAAVLAELAESADRAAALLEAEIADPG